MCILSNISIHTSTIISSISMSGPSRARGTSPDRRDRKPRPQPERQMTSLDKHKIDQIRLETQIYKISVWGWGPGFLLHRWGPCRRTRAARTPSR